MKSPKSSAPGPASPSPACSKKSGPSYSSSKNACTSASSARTKPSAPSRTPSAAAAAACKIPNRPIGSFIFCGPTGVGKTELCKALAEVLFDDENAMVRIDMSEFMEKHTVSRLIGAAPGYVGYEEGGKLTEAVRRRPYSVVLLDEIEKAHRDVFNILLQVLDDGRLTDNHGHTVDFTNTIIVMTSNVGSQMIQETFEAGGSYDEMRNGVMESLQTRFLPEFLNRIDEIIVFRPLDRSQIRKIVDLQVEHLAKLLEQRDFGLEVTDKARDELATRGYDPAFGARPLKRVVPTRTAKPAGVGTAERRVPRRQHDPHRLRRRGFHIHSRRRQQRCTAQKRQRPRRQDRLRRV